MTRPNYARTRVGARKKPKKVGMNKTEALYRDRLELMLLAGEILAYDYEPERLKLAYKTYYIPDFRVIYPDGRLEFVEVKAATKHGKALFTEMSKCKIKIAAELHWMYRFVGAYLLPKAAGGGWKFEHFNEGDEVAHVAD